MRFFFKNDGQTDRPTYTIRQSRIKIILYPSPIPMPINVWLCIIHQTEQESNSEQVFQFYYNLYDLCRNIPDTSKQVRNNFQICLFVKRRVANTNFFLKIIVDVWILAVIEDVGFDTVHCNRWGGHFRFNSTKNNCTIII